MLNVGETIAQHLLEIVVLLLIASLLAGWVVWLFTRSRTVQSTAEVERWRKQYTDSNTELTQVNAQYTDLNTKHTDLDGRLNVAVAENTRLNDQLRNLQLQYEEVQRLNQACQQKVTDLEGYRTRYDELNTRYLGLETELTSLRGQAGKWEEERVQLSTQLSSTHNEQGELLSELERLRRMTADQMQSVNLLQEVQSDFERMHTPSTEMDVAKPQADTTLPPLSDNTNQPPVGTTTLNVHQEHTKISELEEMLKKRGEMINTLQNELNQYKEQFQGWEQHRSQMHIQINDLQREVENYRLAYESMQTLRTEYDELEHLYQTLLNEREEQVQVFGELRNRVDDFSSRMAEVEQMRTSYEQLQADHAAANEQRQSLEQQLADLENERGTLQQYLNQLQADQQSQTAQLIQVQADLDDCRRQSATLPTDNPETTEEVAIDEPEVHIETREEAMLHRVRQRAANINFDRIGTAEEHERDDLKLIRGIGGFIEKKLNALGIYTFRQIAAFTPEDEDIVNEAIEFFNGRVRRDEWMYQATAFDALIRQNELPYDYDQQDAAFNQMVIEDRLSEGLVRFFKR